MNTFLEQFNKLKSNTNLQIAVQMNTFIQALNCITPVVIILYRFVYKTRKHPSI